MSDQTNELEAMKPEAAEIEVVAPNVHDVAAHIAAVLQMPYSGAEVQARLMEADEMSKATTVQTGNDMQAHLFDVSQRIAKASRSDDAEEMKAAVDDDEPAPKKKRK